jgi:hypothetical protein
MLSGENGKMQSISNPESVVISDSYVKAGA